MSIGHNLNIKKKVRDDLNQKVEEFLAKNGKIKEVPPGVSGDQKLGMTLKEMVDMDKARGKTRVDRAVWPYSQNRLKTGGGKC